MAAANMREKGNSNTPEPDMMLEDIFKQNAENNNILSNKHFIFVILYI